MPTADNLPELGLQVASIPPFSRCAILAHSTPTRVIVEAAETNAQPIPSTGRLGRGRTRVGSRGKDDGKGRIEMENCINGQSGLPGLVAGSVHRHSATSTPYRTHAMSHKEETEGFWGTRPHPH